MLSGVDPARRAGTMRLLWLACRRHPDPAEVSRALELGVDPKLLAAAAVRHRIVGLLWRALGSAGALDVLAGERSLLEQIVEIQRLRDVLLVPRALELAAGPLTRSGFEPLVLKGPAVAASYPAPGLRSFDDLDLVLPRRQHADAVEVLRRSGWSLVRKGARDHYDSLFVHESVPDMPLELHYELEAWYDRASSLRGQELWQRRQPAQLMGVPAHVLPRGDDVVMLCAHAAKPYHGFSRLMWIADLAMVLGDAAEGGQRVDWQRVRELTRQGRCSTAVAAALSLAALAGADSPADLRMLPRGGWRGEALRRLAEGEWVLRRTPPVHLRFALADSRRRRMMLLVGYTHPAPRFRGLEWRFRIMGPAVRRWRDLRGRGRGAGEPVGSARA